MAKRDAHNRKKHDPESTSTREQDMAPRSSGSGTDYDKLNTQQATGTQTGSGLESGSPAQAMPGGASIPDSGVGSGNPPGGISTSDSTVSAGGTTGGANPGLGSTTERGYMPTRGQMQQSGDQFRRQVGGTMSGQEEFTPSTAPGGQVSTSGQTGKHGRGKHSPLSAQEAREINEDARLNSGVAPGPDVGHDQR